MHTIQSVARCEQCKEMDRIDNLSCVIYRAQDGPFPMLVQRWFHASRLC